MIQKLFHHPLLVRGVICLSSASLLGNGVGIAQSQPQPQRTEPVVLEPVLAEPLEVAPTRSAPLPVPPVPAAPESFSPETSPAVNLSPRTSGVPQTTEAPTAVILNERSTGCKTTLTAGIAASPCGAEGVSGTVATGRSLPNLSSVNVGAITVQPGGLGWSSAAIGTTPSLKDYYRRTLRPPGQLGNGNIRLMFPLSIPAAISSIFGWRVHPISGDARFHTGTDLAAPLGTPVLAAYAGRVALADFLGGYGLAVALDHNNGTQQTLYGHLSEVFVKQGESVEQGDVIGRVGSTGNSTGPHLHFEFRQLTPEGWVAMDAGTQLEYALAQLVQSLEFAQAPPTSAKTSVGVAGVISGDLQSVTPRPQPTRYAKLDPVFSR